MTFYLSNFWQEEIIWSLILGIGFYILINFIYYYFLFRKGDKKW